MKGSAILFLFFIVLSTGLYAQQGEYSCDIQPGFYYMLDFPVNVRSEPNTRGGIIGQLRLHERIEVLENVGNEQKIDNVWACWYKIRYNNNIGYIWGGSIAIGTLIIDIDNNGIDDYFYYRISQIRKYVFTTVDAWQDVIIYINNEKIPTNGISSNTSLNPTNHIWITCQFEKTNRNTILIKMGASSPAFENIDIFEVDKTGQIRFVENIYFEY